MRILSRRERGGPPGPPLLARVSEPRGRQTVVALRQAMQDLQVNGPGDGADAAVAQDEHAGARVIDGAEAGGPVRDAVVAVRDQGPLRGPAQRRRVLRALVAGPADVLALVVAVVDDAAVAGRRVELLADQQRVARAVADA